MKIHSRYIYSFLAALLLVLLLAGLSAQAQEPPRLRVVHAAPGLTNVDIYVNDVLFFDNTFFGYISPYVPVDPGDRTLRVRPADTSGDFPSLIEINAPYGEDRDYTLIVAGKLEDLEYWRLDDDNKFPGETTARVRFVHASADSPTTEFCLGEVCHILAFKQDTGYFRLDPGTYIPAVRINNTGSNFINTPPLLLKNDSVHTIVMMGEEEGKPGLKLVYTLDSDDTGSALPGLAPHAPGALPGSAAPPPAYPPTTGVFFSPQLIRALMVGLTLIIIVGLGLRAIWRRNSLQS
jgi:hypothetical protein